MSKEGLKVTLKHLKEDRDNLIKELEFVDREIAKVEAKLEAIAL